MPSIIEITDETTSMTTTSPTSTSMTVTAPTSTPASVPGSRSKFLNMSFGFNDAGPRFIDPDARFFIAPGLNWEGRSPCIIPVYPAKKEAPLSQKEKRRRRRGSLVDDFGEVFQLAEAQAKVAEDTFFAYDAKQSAINGQATYCVLSRVPIKSEATGCARANETVTSSDSSDSEASSFSLSSADSTTTDPDTSSDALVLYSSKSAGAAPASNEEVQSPGTWQTSTHIFHVRRHFLPPAPDAGSFRRPAYTRAFKPLPCESNPNTGATVVLLCETVKGHLWLAQELPIGGDEGEVRFVEYTKGGCVIKID